MESSLTVCQLVFDICLVEPAYTLVDRSFFLNEVLTSNLKVFPAAGTLLSSTLVMLCPKEIDKSTTSLVVGVHLLSV